MSDIQTIWDAAGGRGDYQVSAGALASGLDVRTAVLISLFTDRLALPDDEIPDSPAVGAADRRGWWADDGDVRIGSRLWLLDRAKAPQDLVSRAEQYAREALQWMLDDGIVARFDIRATWLPSKTLALAVTAFRKDGGTLSTLNSNLW